MRHNRIINVLREGQVYGEHDKDESEDADEGGDEDEDNEDDVDTQHRCRLQHFQFVLDFQPPHSLCHPALTL